jgi:hypothetical protein
MNGLPWRPPVEWENISIVLFEEVAELKAKGITDQYYTGTLLFFPANIINQSISL